MNNELDAASQQALDSVLQGEFGFYGLISTRRDLPAPVFGWHYQRTTDRLWRTVTCSSTRSVPHGDDLAIFQTLLSLCADHADTTQRIVSAAFLERLALLSPRVVLSSEQLIQGLDRLVYSSLKVCSVVRTGGQPFTVVHQFPLISVLSLVTSAEYEPRFLDTLAYQLPEVVWRLYLTGSLRLEET